MSTFPEHDPLHPDAPAPIREDELTPEEVLKAVHSLFPYSVPDPVAQEETSIQRRPRQMTAWADAEDSALSERRPNVVDVLILGLMALLGLLGSSLVVRWAIHDRLFGVTSMQKAFSDVHYTIGSMAVLYVITFGAALIVFPLFWRQSLFAGMHWNAHAAMRRFKTLFGAACICFLLAMADEALLPGPANAPIDKLFDNRAAAWLLFAFGITVAPFFEECIFRGFLLPAFCTAFDWSVERAAKLTPMPMDPEGHPQWSLGAMVFASIFTSIPFAWMHAEQTGYSLGPFVLLVAVSLVLSWARLATRSLAASVVVHGLYNFLLFFLMLVGTGGFRHMERM
jgi:membrane protease YdiL (CAAX protease family)